MSVIGSNVLAGASGSAVAGFQIDRSLRFNSADSAYGERSNWGTPTNRKKGTLSVWAKRSTLSGNNRIFHAYDGSSTGSFDISFNSDDTIGFNFGGSAEYANKTNALFRDASAWYHLVFVWDTTDATSSNRLKVYVNGTQQTLATSNYPGQNHDAQFPTASTDSASGTFIGAGYGPGSYLNGSLAELYFVDGQALAPTDFGEFDADTGVWNPIEYAGTYGTNGFHLDFSDASSNSALGNDSSGNNNDWTNNNLVAEQPTTLPGVAFDGSGDYLSIPNDSDFLFGTGDFTLECFASFDNATTGTSTLLGMWGLTTSQASWLMYRDGANLIWYVSTNGSTQTAALTVSHGMSANIWNHIAFVRSSGTTTIYVNGVSKGSTGTAYNLHAATCDFVLGYNPLGGTPDYMDGRVSNARIVKGTAVYTSNFTTPTAPLSNVTNTKLLCCQSSSSATAATVSPGTITANGNASATEFTDSTSANDSLIDTPTNYVASANNGGNYATLNPLAKSTNVTLSNGNLDYTAPNASNTYGSALSTIGVSSGKWYAEYVWTSGSSNSHVGVATGDINFETWLGNNAGAYTYYADGTKYNNGTSSSYGASYANGDVIGVAFDADAGTLVFYKNGTSQGTAFTGLTSGPYFFGVGMGPAGQTATFNFGARPFQYTPPTGHLSLCTQNLDDPSIADPSTAFNAATWNGDGTNGRNIPTGHSTDLVWIKRRNSTNSHTLTDIIRGVNVNLRSNTTGAETTDANSVPSFDTDGFSVGSDGAFNGSGGTFVGWSWDGGTSTASNTDGSITTNVRASQANGFSIATYTGNGSANQTLGHGLGAAPAFVIIKDRSSSQNWAVLHTSAGTLGTLDGGTNYKLLELNGTAAARDASYNTIWHPTSTTVKIGEGASSAHWTNKSGDDYVMYSWTPVSQYSAFGSYTGNGSTDGPFVYTGMRPRWIMIKSASSTGNWAIYDTERDTDNAATQELYADTNGAENNSGPTDILSNGFKLRNTHGHLNVNSVDYVWAAFAEHPLKTARAR